MTKIPFLDLHKLHAGIDTEIRRAIDAVLAHGKFISGPEIQKFEQEWASLTGAPTAIGVSNGTSALHAILECLGIGAGDEVILPSHTFVATAESIRMTGARPVFAEIHPETWTLDPAALKPLINGRTRAIVPVHIYGAPADMDAINDIACSHGLPVIEDAAQGHAALLGSKRVGALGLAAAFSFFPGKNLGAFGDAGAVTTIDEALGRKIRLYVNHGRVDKYEHLAMGTNYRLDTLQAAILLAKLPHLEEWTARRRAVAQTYQRVLSAAPYAGRVSFQRILPNAQSCYHLFVVAVPERDRVQKFLNDRGIGTGIHYPIPCHLQPSMRDFGPGEGSLPVTEQLCREIISLPMCPTMTEADAEYVCDTLAEAMEAEA